jgi:hypothetical protein
MAWTTQISLISLTKIAVWRKRFLRLARPHSITSSAAASNLSGTMIPGAVQ